jgi:hypothetical protein
VSVREREDRTATTAAIPIASAPAITMYATDDRLLMRSESVQQPGMRLLR